MKYLLSTKNLYLKIQNKLILNNINIALEQGTILTIVGPNGGGKSSLIKILVGLLAPTQGAVYREPNICIGYTPQRFQLDATLPLTVERFLNLIPHKKNEQKNAQKNEKNKNINNQLDSLLDEVGVPGVRFQAMQSLSGGELQRVLLARALLRKPQLLVLDEPAQGVDLAGQNDLYRLIVKIRDRHDCSIIMVSHDLSLVMAQTDVVFCLNQHVCCSGSPESVTQDPQFLKLFGLEAQSFALYTHRHDHDHK